uniref:Uncharacterized protein n=1 Tax=Daphnia galeata TaxID=27404 RepID=A0A8J2RKI9_9CRUS|nr:unnamed protein product [Daphnia galeata]
MVDSYFIKRGHLGVERQSRRNLIRVAAGLGLTFINQLVRFVRQQEVESFLFFFAQIVHRSSVWTEMASAAELSLIVQRLETVASKLESTVLLGAQGSTTTMPGNNNVLPS